MKKTLIITLCLFVPFLLLAQRPYPYAQEYGDTGYIVFKDYKYQARKVKVRDEIAYDDFDFTQKKCPVPAELSISNNDIEQGKVDFQTAKNICASKTEFMLKSDWKWRIPTQDELEVISSLEKGTEYFKNKVGDTIMVYLSDIKGYELLNRDKYWVSTEVDGKPASLDLSNKKMKLEQTSQDTPQYVRCVRDLCRIQPKFQGEGLNKFRGWITSNLKYPEAARKKGVEGVLIVEFFVERDGSIGNIKPITFNYYHKPKKEHTPEYEMLIREAIRTLKASPKWEPAAVNGHNVRVKYTLPLAFRAY